MRTERDSLGEKNIPDEALYGVHTVRSLENFQAGGEHLPLDIIYAIVKLKLACARANVALGILEKDKGEAVRRAGERVLAGEFDDQFPVDVFQAGSGTSSHMNVNEVLANIACEELGGKRGDRALVHPNDHVNKGQSTNNIFPSAIRIAVVGKTPALIGVMEHLIEALLEKEQAFSDILKSGRTHLQDAVPVTLGQEFGAYAQALKKDVARLRRTREKLFELGAGGNAVGTGLNTNEKFRSQIVLELRGLTDEPYLVAKNGFEATQFLTDLAEMSAILKLLSIDLMKIANDLRLLSSGPSTGLGEINLPAVEPGSSIMPGKINPSICEAVNMICFQVAGYDHAVSSACAAGQLELNTHMPLIGLNLVKTLDVLTSCCAMFADQCLAGITANRETCARNFENSAGLATILNPRLGYDRVAELVKESLETGKTLKTLVLEKKIMGENEWAELLKSSTGPNL